MVSTAAGEVSRGPELLAAELISTRMPPRARVLVLGSGTGDVASELSARGYEVTALEADGAALALARERDCGTTWIHARPDDLAIDGRVVDLVLVDAPVVTDRPRGTLVPLLARASRHVRSGGEVVAGFPLAASAVSDAWSLAEYDRAAALSGLAYAVRYGDWGGTAYRPGMPYAVSVHRRR